MVGKRPQCHTASVSTRGDLGWSEVAVRNSGVAMQVGVHHENSGNYGSFYCNASKRIYRRPIGQSNDPAASRSRAECFDQRCHPFGLIVMKHVPGVIDDLLAPVGERLETLLEFGSRHLSGDHR